MGGGWAKPKYMPPNIVWAPNAVGANVDFQVKRRDQAIHLMLQEYIRRDRQDLGCQIRKLAVEGLLDGTFKRGHELIQFIHNKETLGNANSILLDEYLKLLTELEENQTQINRKRKISLDLCKEEAQTEDKITKQKLINELAGEECNVCEGKGVIPAGKLEPDWGKGKIEVSGGNKRYYWIYKLPLADDWGWDEENDQYRNADTGNTQHKRSRPTGWPTEDPPAPKLGAVRPIDLNPGVAVWERPPCRNCGGYKKHERDELSRLELKALRKKKKEKDELVTWIIADQIQRNKIIKWGKNELNAYTLKELKSVKERIVTAQRRWRKAGVATVTSVTGRFSMAGPRVGELTPAEERLPGY